MEFLKLGELLCHKRYIHAKDLKGYFGIDLVESVVR
jgi:hypothetical protein